MAKGRKSTPDELKNLRGTLQSCRVSSSTGSDAVQRLTSVSAPAFLDAQAKKIFKAKSDQLIALRILTPMDVDQLAIYAQAYSLVIKALKELRKNGDYNTVYNDMGQISAFVENPYMKMYRENVVIVQKMAPRFGFDPVSRKDIMAAVEPKKEKDDFDDFG